MFDIICLCNRFVYRNQLKLYTMNKNEQIEVQLFVKRFTEEQLLEEMKIVRDSIKELNDAITLCRIFNKKAKLKYYIEMKEFFASALRLAETEYLSR